MEYLSGNVYITDSVGNTSSTFRVDFPTGTKLVHLMGAGGVTEYYYSVPYWNANITTATVMPWLGTKTALHVDSQTSASCNVAAGCHRIQEITCTDNAGSSVGRWVSIADYWVLDGFYNLTWVPLF